MLGQRIAFLANMRSNRYWPWIWISLAGLLVLRTGLRPPDRGVILDHLEFGRRLLQGLDLYAPFGEDKPLHPPYPPSFGLLTAPFSLLPTMLARFAWGILQMLALYSIGLSLREFLRQWAPKLLPNLHVILLLTALVASRYILRDTHGGGGNLINLALVLASLRLARQGREQRAGLLLGFSLATKPTALLVLPLLWFLGQRRTASTAVLTALGCMALALVCLRQDLAPFLQWFDGSLQYAAMRDVFATPAQGFPPFTWMNQCLRCCVQRYLGEVPAEFAAQVPHFFGGLGLAPAVTAWCNKLLGLAMLSATAYRVWQYRKDPAARPFLVAMVLALSLLLSPISWKAHHVALLPALFLMVCQGMQGRRWAWYFLALYFGLCTLGEQFVGREYKNLQQSLYLVTAGTVGLWAVLWSGVARAQTQPQEGLARTSIRR